MRRDTAARHNGRDVPFSRDTEAGRAGQPRQRLAMHKHHSSALPFFTKRSLAIQQPTAFEGKGGKLLPKAITIVKIAATTYISFAATFISRVTLSREKIGNSLEKDESGTLFLTHMV